MSLSVDVSGSTPFAFDAVFDVDRGRTLALVGESGAGKSTILRCIAGLHKPERGRITCDGTTWFDSERRVFEQPHRRSVAVTFPNGALFGAMTVIENAAFGLRASGRSARESTGRALEALDVTGVAHLAERRAHTLSSGEAQRVALARAIALRPAALLLDEPLSSVDVRARPALRLALIAAIKDSSSATVLVTHDPADAMLLSDRLAVVEGGVVVQRGTSAELRRAPATPYVAAFAGVNLFSGIARAESDGTSIVRLAGQPDGDGLVVMGVWSGPVAVVVEPDAVTISRDQSPTSARNRFTGPVESMVPDGGVVRVSIASEPPVIARITARSATALGLEPGAIVHATFKAGEARVS
jgi:molybdate transport system ATP-binding protein